MNSLEQIIQAKNNKNKIIKMIKNTPWCGRAQKEKNRFIFWIENDCGQFQIMFCEDCGNYVYECGNDTLLCRCSI
jgi:hypothetical protein